MPITANVLYRDSFNFFRNQLVSILMLALLTASISVLLNQILGTDAEMLKILSATKGDFAASASMDIQEFIHQMTPEQQLMLLKASAAAAFSALVGNALLI
ncbi:MAG: YciC family protein, partial [Serratia symbiotica]|nr:YciC family protein [Serratia symbiotica]